MKVDIPSKHTVDLTSKKLKKHIFTYISKTRADRKKRIADLNSAGQNTLGTAITFSGPKPCKRVLSPIRLHIFSPNFAY